MFDPDDILKSAVEQLQRELSAMSTRQARDGFAAHAMRALIDHTKDYRFGEHAEALAKEAYAVAEAMMTVRGKP